MFLRASAGEVAPSSRATGGATPIAGHVQVLDVDLTGYFNNVRHHFLLEKIQRVQDPEILHLVKLILKANGKKGVPQGGVISPQPHQGRGTEKVRRFVRKNQRRPGFGWKRWSTEVIYGHWGLFNDYQICYFRAASPSR